MINEQNRYAILVEEAANEEEEKENFAEQFTFDVRDNCIFFLNNQCHYSDHFCRNAHNHAEKAEYQKKPKKPCYYFLQHKTCRFGDKCFNSHTYEWVPKQLAQELKKENKDLQNEKKEAQLKIKEHKQLVEELKRENGELKQDIMEKDKQICALRSKTQKQKDPRTVKFDASKLLFECRVEASKFVKNICDTAGLSSDYLGSVSIFIDEYNKLELIKTLAQNSTKSEDPGPKQLQV